MGNIKDARQILIKDAIYKNRYYVRTYKIFEDCYSGAPGVLTTKTIKWLEEIFGENGKLGDIIDYGLNKTVQDLTLKCFKDVKKLLYKYDLTFEKEDILPPSLDRVNKEMLENPASKIKVEDVCFSEIKSVDTKIHNRLNNGWCATENGTLGELLAYGADDLNYCLGQKLFSYLKDFMQSMGLFFKDEMLEDDGTGKVALYNEFRNSNYFIERAFNLCQLNSFEKGSQSMEIITQTFQEYLKNLSAKEEQYLNNRTQKNMEKAKEIHDRIDELIDLFKSIVDDKRRELAIVKANALKSYQKFQEESSNRKSQLASYSSAISKKIGELDKYYVKPNLKTRGYHSYNPFDDGIEME